MLAQQRSLIVSSLSVFIFWACSSGTDDVYDGAAKALDVCKFAGEVSCGVDQDGVTAAVLLCKVTDDLGRVWVLTETCAYGCQDALCQAAPEIVEDVHGDGPTDLMPGDLIEDEFVEEICVPDCTGKNCGGDGCGGLCGTCPIDHICGEEYECVFYCAPKCANRQCGPDGCGDTCGTCPFGMACVSGLCRCAPHCEGKNCGPDGCGGTCGECALGFQCSPFGECEELCQPSCEGKACGSDSCGGTCGQCPFGLYCSPDGACTTTCYPTCEGKECGDDGCQGSCGDCPCPMCSPTEVECGPAGLCTEGPGLTCDQLMTCLGDCAGEATCQQECLDASSPEAQAQYIDMIDCLETYGYFDCPSGDTACTDAAWNQCQNEVQGCFQGQLTCSEILDCMGACPVEEPNCSTECFYDGTVQGQAIYQAIINCIIAECGPIPTDECQMDVLVGVCWQTYLDCLDDLPES